jgi:hypothetical protein
VDQPGKDIGSSNASGVGIGDRDRCFVDQRGASLIEGSVRAVPVVVIQVFGEDDFEMAAAEDEEPVQALPADGADKPLRDRVGARRPDGRLEDPDPFSAEDGVEGGGELRVAISNEELDRCCPFRQVVAKVAGLLGDPARDRIGLKGPFIRSVP